MTLDQYPISALRSLLRALASNRFRRALRRSGAIASFDEALNAARDAISTIEPSVAVDVTAALWTTCVEGYRCIDVHGPLIPYPCWDASQGRFADDDVERRVYALIAMLAGQQLAAHGRRKRGVTNWRMASAVMDEVRTSQLCRKCDGAGCRECGQTGLIRQAMRWRSDACEAHQTDWRDHVDGIYSELLLWVVERDRAGLRSVAMASKGENG